MLFLELYSSNFHLALSVVLLMLQSKHTYSIVCTRKLMYCSAGLAGLEWCSVSVSQDVNTSVSSINPEVLSWVRKEENEDNCYNISSKTCSFLSRHLLFKLTFSSKLAKNIIQFLF